MKTVAFVPIKLNNQRFPGKNIKKFDDGLSLVEVFLNTLLCVPNIDRVYVFCSNEEIRKYIPNHVTFLKRPSFLDTPEATPQDIMKVFIDHVDADIYAVCHCTSPFVTVEHINEGIEAVKKNGYDSAFTCEKIQRLLWKSNNKPLNFNPQEIPRTQDLSPLFCEVSAAYIFNKEVFLSTGRRIGNNPYIIEVTGVEAIDIDYPEDFEIANAVYMQFLKERSENEACPTS